MLSYQTQLLEAICDKLGIDYAEMKAAEIKRLKAADAKYRERKKELDEQKAALAKDRARWEAHKASVMASTYNVKPATDEERPSVEMAYIKADREATAAREAWLDAASELHPNPIEVAELQQEYNLLRQKAGRIKARLYPGAA